MTLAGDSILVTPGAGATVATHTVDSKEHQVVMVADETGHIHGTKATWHIATGNSANVAAARTTHFDLFNASGSGTVVEVWEINIIPTLTAVTGVGLTWEIIRTSAVGTGGSTLTPGKFDTTTAAMASQVTGRSKASGGATTDATNPLTIFLNTSSEETSPYAGLATFINHVPGDAHLGRSIEPLILREGEGIKIDQTLNSNVGSTNIAVVFTVS